MVDKALDQGEKKIANTPKREGKGVNDKWQDLW